MKMTWKTMISLFFSILGGLCWLYIGGWLALSRPLKGLIAAHVAGSLSIGKLAFAMIESFIYLSLGGGVWCIGYMLSNYFREES